LKIEVRCGGCGRGYLVDEAKVPSGGGLVPCQSCGASIELKPSRVATPPPAPKPPAVEPARARASANEVCCPRCNLHFVPDVRTKPRSTGRPTLLIVEDMEYFVEIARDALAGRYELKIARSLDEARALLLSGGIDLMLLDLTLEKGEDGLRLLREPPGKICPVLLFTAQDESEMYGEGWEKLLALGVDDVVIKGMNMDEALSRKVAEMLGEPLPQDSYRR
jgi:CheY-like chemotaxis protein